MVRYSQRPPAWSLHGRQSQKSLHLHHTLGGLWFANTPPANHTSSIVVAIRHYIIIVEWEDASITTQVFLSTHEWGQACWCTLNWSRGILKNVMSKIPLYVYPKIKQFDNRTLLLYTLYRPCSIHGNRILYRCEENCRESSVGCWRHHKQEKGIHCTSVAETLKKGEGIVCMREGKKHWNASLYLTTSVLGAFIAIAF